MKRSLVAISVAAAIVTGCNDAETAKSAVDTTVELSGMFPTDMMVTSPMQKKSASKLSDGASYSEAVEAIEDAGESLSDFGNRFDPAYFFGDVVDAKCFGPQVKYQNHPDGTDNADPTLPSGDVGIWLETNGTKNEACAAAETNAQLKGAASRVFMSLVSFAGLVGNAVADGGLPNRGSSKDLTSRMDSRGLSNVDFTSVTLEQTSSGVWKYNIDLEYVNPTPVSEHMKDASDEDSDGNTTESVNQRIVLAMEHQPGSSSSQFEGVINYRMDDYFNPSGNCQSIQDASGGAKITHNGSLHYKRTGDTITLQHRFA